MSFQSVDSSVAKRFVYKSIETQLEIALNVSHALDNAVVYVFYAKNYFTGGAPFCVARYRAIKKDGKFAVLSTATQVCIT